MDSITWPRDFLPLGDPKNGKEIGVNSTNFYF
jgi:hypothetical protein